MEILKKYVFGMRPHPNHFSIASDWGTIVNHIFNARGSKNFKADYFRHIGG
ncbi:MAG: hypothetical protein HN600_13940 [Bacteroidetes bacterium]|jgi:hypothetical protein|nr:hypothetical protein [Bacteroidota bacterium]